MNFSAESIDKFAAQIETEGYAVLENALGPDFLGEVTAAVTRIEQKAA